MSHPSEYGRLRFCPKCGTAKTKRDYFPADGPGVPDAKQPRVGAEYICDNCGFAFWISKSRRVVHAELLFSIERKRRAPVKFTEACIGTEVAQLYLSESDPPMLKTFKSKLSNLFKRKAQRQPEPLWPHRDDLASRRRCKCKECLNGASSQSLKQESALRQTPQAAESKDEKVTETHRQA